MDGHLSDVVWSLHDRQKLNNHREIFNSVRRGTHGVMKFNRNHSRQTLITTTRPCFKTRYPNLATRRYLDMDRLD